MHIPPMTTAKHVGGNRRANCRCRHVDGTSLTASNAAANSASKTKTEKSASQAGSRPKKAADPFHGPGAINRIEPTTKAIIPSSETSIHRRSIQNALLSRSKKSASHCGMIVSSLISRPTVALHPPKIESKGLRKAEKRSQSTRFIERLKL